MRWVIATDLGARSLIKEFVNVLEGKEQIIYPVSMEQLLTPDWKPIINDNIDTIFYGSTNFIERMSKLNYFPGVYGNNDMFSYENLIKHIPKEMLLNDPESAVRGTAQYIINYIKNKNFNNDDLMFFKPGNDSKIFAGSVMTIKDILQICNNIDLGILPDADKDFPLLLSIPYGISHEYRLFIVDGKIITSSEYLPNVNNGCPKIVSNFAQDVIQKWCPTDIYTLDICLSAGKPYIMEIQNFHSAGFYDCDLNLLANAIIEKFEYKKDKDMICR